jgi:hypothetical protein
MGKHTTPEQTLLLLQNNPVYTKKIRGLVSLMKYEASVRPTLKYVQLPPYLKELTALSPLFSQDSKLEFSWGEVLLGKLKDCFNGAIRTGGGDLNNHRGNFDQCARLLLAH